MPLFTIHSPAVNITINNNSNVPVEELTDLVTKAVTDVITPLINAQTTKIMNTLDDVLAEVQKNSTLGDSIVTLLTETKTRLDQVLSGTVIPPAVQAKIDAIFNVTKADSDKIEAAVVANTDAAPEAPAEETPTTP